jgi:pimeloyl-ACP methyl ester carboxylesterase
MAIVRANGLDFQVSRFRSGAPGSRPVLVGIHGLGIVDNASLSMTLGMPLAKSFDVVLYDLRGHGRSQFVDRGYTVADHVGDLCALLDALDLRDPVHLLAGSYGGAIGVTMALHHPERVRSLSMVDPNFPLPEWGENLAVSLSFYAERVQGDDAVSEIMAATGSRARRRAEALVERGRKLLLDTTLLDDVRRERSLTMEEYAQITCPVLAVYGTGSPIYVLSGILRELIKRCEIATVEGADHIQTFHRPETREAITEFVRRVEAEQAAGAATP